MPDHPITSYHTYLVKIEILVEKKLADATKICFMGKIWLFTAMFFRFSFQLNDQYCRKVAKFLLLGYKLSLKWHVFSFFGFKFQLSSIAFVLATDCKITGSLLYLKFHCDCKNNDTSLLSNSSLLNHVFTSMENLELESFKRLRYKLVLVWEMILLSTLSKLKEGTMM